MDGPEATSQKNIDLRKRGIDMLHNVAVPVLTYRHSARLKYEYSLIVGDRKLEIDRGPIR